jgi:hypothetical protein
LDGAIRGNAFHAAADQTGYLFWFSMIGALARCTLYGPFRKSAPLHILGLAAALSEDRKPL